MSEKLIEILELLIYFITAVALFFGSKNSPLHHCLTCVDVFVMLPLGRANICNSHNSGLNHTVHKLITVNTVNRDFNMLWNSLVFAVTKHFVILSM